MSMTDTETDKETEKKEALASALREQARLRHVVRRLSADNDRLNRELFHLRHQLQLCQRKTNHNAPR
jgi:hypothetical protein